MAGRVGNKGYNYFSEEAYRNLQKAVDIMTKLEQVTKSNVKSEKEQVELITRYKAQLEDLGVKKNTSLKSLERELAVETEIMKTRKKEADYEKEKEIASKKRIESSERVAKFERDYQREISNRKKEEIEQQRELDKLISDAKKRISEKTLSEQKYNKELNKVVQKYKEIQNINEANRRKESKAEAKKDFKEGVVGAIFGTSKQDIQDVKDGVYWWKFGLKVFTKAVDIFKQSVEEGIKENYNNTEQTLNRVTASNRMSWNSGSFSFGGRNYTGYSKINNAINDKLWADGLYNNISNTDISKAMAELTSSGGYGLEDALAKGYQDTVIKYIVPYLDTANEAFNNLEVLMPRNFQECSSN